MDAVADFILAVALICPNQNMARALEILTPKPVLYEKCVGMSADAALRKRYRRGDEPDADGCERDLICVRVLWRGR